MGENVEQAVKRIQGALNGFAEDMRAQGIHVGFGSPPVCVNCAEPWPCSHERGASNG